VSKKGVAAITEDFIARDDAAHDVVAHGFALDGDEQRRRFVIQSLLQAPGLDLARYAARFGSAALDDLPRLRDLGALATLDDARLALTPAGLERSDAIGPWLYSDRVLRLMAGYETT
jgi:oxygen-independent coproporphyrinogen III oxidase